MSESKINEKYNFRIINDTHLKNIQEITKNKNGNNYRITEKQNLMILCRNLNVNIYNFKRIIMNNINYLKNNKVCVSIILSIDDLELISKIPYLLAIIDNETINEWWSEEKMPNNIKWYASVTNNGIGSGSNYKNNEIDIFTKKLFEIRDTFKLKTNNFNTLKEKTEKDSFEILKLITSNIFSYLELLLSNDKKKSLNKRVNFVNAFTICNELVLLSNNGISQEFINYISSEEFNKLFIEKPPTKPLVVPPKPVTVPPNPSGVNNNNNNMKPEKITNETAKIPKITTLEEQKVQLQKSKTYMLELKQSLSYLGTPPNSNDKYTREELQTKFWHYLRIVVIMKWIEENNKFSEYFELIDGVEKNEDELYFSTDINKIKSNDKIKICKYRISYCKIEEYSKMKDNNNKRALWFLNMFTVYAQNPGEKTGTAYIRNEKQTSGQAAEELNSYNNDKNPKLFKVGKNPTDEMNFIKFDKVFYKFINNNFEKDTTKTTNEIKNHDNNKTGAQALIKAHPKNKIVLDSVYDIIQSLSSEDAGDIKFINDKEDKLLNLYKMNSVMGTEKIKLILKRFRGLVESRFNLRSNNQEKQNLVSGNFKPIKPQIGGAENPIKLQELNNIITNYNTKMRNLLFDCIDCVVNDKNVKNIKKFKILETVITKLKTISYENNIQPSTTINYNIINIHKYFKESKEIKYLDLKTDFDKELHIFNSNDNKLYPQPKQEEPQKGGKINQNQKRKSKINKNKSNKRKSNYRAKRNSIRKCK
jgi:hypothetical protein